MNYNEDMSSNTAQTIQNNEYSIFNPESLFSNDWFISYREEIEKARNKTSNLDSHNDVKRELVKCNHFAQKTIKCFSAPFSSDFTITVYEESIMALRRLLKEHSKRRSSSYDKTIRLYALIRVLNIMNIFHIGIEDFIMLLGGGKKKSIREALADLEAAQLVKKYRLFNNKSRNCYNAYCAYPLEDKPKNIKATIVYKYDSIVLKEKYSNIKGLNIDKAYLDVNQDETTEIVTPTFRTLRTGWYNELYIIDEKGQYIPPKLGHFSDKDHRFYHTFHLLSKEVRLSTVWWNRINLTEIWDANASFFLVLCYMLRNKQWNNTNIERRIQTETERMLNLCLRGIFYDEILCYYNRNSECKKKREEIKKLCQAYKTRWRSYYFKKDGNYKGYRYLKKYIPIDQYFLANFPTIRDYILDSEVVIEENERAGSSSTGWNGRRYKEPKTKKVSTLHRDVISCEFQLISEGICKILYEEYGIKSVTVHDAIYIKQTDVPYCPHITPILRRLLNLPSLPQPTILNPAYSDGYVAAEPVMYQFNLNTPAVTQLRVS